MKTFKKKKRKGYAVGFTLLLLLVAVSCLVFLIFQRQPAVNQPQTFVFFSAGFTDRKISDQESALSAVGDLSAELGFGDPSAVFLDCQESMVLENTYYRFEQSFRGIPVYGRSLVVGADKNGDSLILSGNYLDLGQMETTPRLDSAAAMEVAAQVYGEDAGIYCERLTIYSLNNCPAELAWQLEVSTNEGWETCFVSAMDGRVLATHSRIHREQILCSGEDTDGETVKFYAEYRDGIYEMNDTQRGIEIYDAKGWTAVFTPSIVDSNGKIYFKKDGKIVNEDELPVTIEGDNYTLVIRDATGNIIGTEGRYFMNVRSGWLLKANANEEHLLMDIDMSQRAVSNSPVWEDSKAVTLMHRLCLVQDFWASDLLKRNGYDDTGRGLIAVYNDYMNADSSNSYASYYDGDVMPSVLSFGKGSDLGMDTVAHECPHFATNSIVTLAGGGESGAISEALSDIFGEITEELTWEKKSPARCDWQQGNRNLADPRQSSYPDTYHGDYWVYPEDKASDGGVHTNSTVLSHAAYLMNTGMEGDSRYEALSTEDLAQLFYQTMQILPSDCSFSEFRSLTEWSARTMEQQGLLTAEQVKCVSYAFFQVGIQSAEVPVAPEVTVTVYSVNGQPYEDYTLYVSDGQTMTQYEGSTLKNQTVDLSKAKRYELLVVDHANPENQTSKTVRVVAQGGVSDIQFATNCGVTKPTEEIGADLNKIPDTGEDSSVFQAKLSELVGIYGLFAPLQTGYVSISQETWLNPLGVMGAQILDFDLDGSNEMLVCLAESCTEPDSLGPQMDASHILMQIYENQDGQAVLQDSQIMGAYNPTTYYETDRKEVLLRPVSITENIISIHILWREDQPSIFCEYQSNAGAFTDGCDQAYWMLEYTDGAFQKICSYTQTSAGSSEFQLMGYRFQDGIPDSGISYYSEYYEFPSLYPHFGQAMDAFFSQYGVKLQNWIKDKERASVWVEDSRTVLSPDNQMEQLFLYSCTETSFYQDGDDWDSQVHGFTATLHRGNNLLEEIPSASSQPSSASSPVSPDKDVSSQGLAYLNENTQFIASGTLVERPYEINSYNKGIAYILQLDTPFTAMLYADLPEYKGEAVKIDEMQINFQDPANNQLYLGKRIIVTGTVMYGHTGHHRTTVLLMDATMNGFPVYESSGPF